jgi:very-short-patch-repair endonuclease
VAAAVHRLDAVASHTTAAALWGIATLNGHDPEIRLTRPRRKQGAIHDYRDVILHHATLSDDHVGVRGGIPVTSVARTVVDLARSQSFRAGVVAADSALRQHLCERDELEAVAAACRGWPGVRRARAVVAFADSRAASPLESISRVAFHDYDLPRPILQALIGGLDLVDFLWERWRVVGEADGLLKYIGPEVLRKEKLREEGIAQLGFAVFRWTWRDAFERPDALAYRAAQILVRNGWRP